MVKCTGIRCPMQYGYKVDECNHMDCPYRTEPMTIADFIRAMSDEELAYFIKFIVSQAQIYGMAYVTKRLEWIDWLKQPAERKVVKKYKKVVDK